MIIFGPLQALAIRWSYLGSGDLFAEFKSHSGKLASIEKDFPWLKTILKRLVRREKFHENFR